MDVTLKQQKATVVLQPVVAEARGILRYLLHFCARQQAPWTQANFSEPSYLDGEPNDSDNGKHHWQAYQSHRSSMMRKGLVQPRQTGARHGNTSSASNINKRKRQQCMEDFELEVEDSLEDFKMDSLFSDTGGSLMESAMLPQEHMNEAASTAVIEPVPNKEHVPHAFTEKIKRQEGSGFGFGHNTGSESIDYISSQWSASAAGFSRQKPVQQEYVEALEYKLLHFFLTANVILAITVHNYIARSNMADGIIHIFLVNLGYLSTVTP